MKHLGMFLAVAGFIGCLAVEHKFFDHNDFNPADYNLFDSFEGYTWHKQIHQADNYSQFYISTQADKEFEELLNITFDVDLVYINDEQKPTYEAERVYPSQDKRLEADPT